MEDENDSITITPLIDPPDDLVETLAVAGGRMLWSLRRILHLDTDEMMHILKHVYAFIHVNTCWCGKCNAHASRSVSYNLDDLVFDSGTISCY